MEQQGQRSRRAIVNRNIVARQRNARAVLRFIGRENLFQYAPEQSLPVADLRRGFRAVGPHEIMGAAQRQDAIAQIVRDVADFRVLARRQADEACDH